MGAHHLLLFMVDVVFKNFVEGVSALISSPGIR